MTSDVVLTAALRNNLLSLQSTQSLIDTTQLRLATGLKVNSALDNPQNFFASEALKNRASDLSRLLDGIGQNIQVIKAADQGVSALTTLVEQADSVTQSARDAIAQGSSEARVTADDSIEGITDLVNSSANISNDDTLVFTITDPTDSANTTTQTITLRSATAGITGTFQATSAAELLTQINEIEDANGNSIVEASFTADGELELRTTNGGNLNVNFVTAGGSDAENLALSEELGFGDAAELVADGGAGTNNVEFTAIASAGLVSFELYFNSATDTLAVGSDDLDALTDEDGNALFGGFGATDTYTIRVNDNTTEAIDLFAAGGGTDATTVQGFVDQINQNASLNTLIEASFDGDTGQVSIRAIDASVESITTGVTGGASADFGFGVRELDSTAATMEETIQLGQAAARLAELEGEYDNLRDQIDQLVTNGDTGYRGTNLLNGDNLETFFNEFRSSSLQTEGVTFNAAGLGLSEANFASVATIDAQSTEVRGALDTVRNFGTTLANDLAIIQTRQDFTQNLINTLNEGSDKLTVADQNEEGAKLLALQTRQQLGVTSLSLASQSQQSILRLF